MNFEWYRIILALHIIAVISWMAGILYLYRLFVYHAEETEKVVKERLIVMEERLSRIILIPAMAFVLLFGFLLLAINPTLLSLPWMHAKLLAVGGLMFFSHFAGKIRRQLKSGTCQWSSKRLRVLNEIPTLLMIGVVFLVILKPDF